MTGLLSGVVAPAATPFDERLEPDAGRFVEHCRWLLAQGCTGLAPFGTTSEANSLSLRERRGLLEALVMAGVAPGLLVPGTGCCSLDETTELSRHAIALGCAGVMTLPPFYYKGLSDEGIFRYFAALVDRIDDPRLRIYLYHIPPIAVVGFSADLVDRLRREFPEVVVGLKDSSGDWSNTARYLERQPGMAIFPGSEGFLLQGFATGGAGCITATANVNPAAIRAVWEARGRPAEAAALHGPVNAVRQAFQALPLIPAVKHVIAHYRQDPGWRRLRPPLVELPAEAGAALTARLDGELGFRFPI